MSKVNGLKVSPAFLTRVIGIDKVVKCSSQQHLFPVWLHSLIGCAMSKRIRAVRFVMLPFAVFAWVIGWALCLTGEKKVTRQNKKSLTVHIVQN
jgi:hypothetical protein